MPNSVRVLTMFVGWQKGHSYVGYSKHELAYIPIAAIHINTSSERVLFAFIRIVSVWFLFRRNQ